MDIWQTCGLVRPMERKPDFERFKLTISGKIPAPVPVGDLFADPRIMEQFIGERVRRPDDIMISGQKDESRMLETGIRFLEQSVKFSLAAGWDFVTAHSILQFPGFKRLIADKTAPAIEGGRRAFVDSNEGPIMSWKDFEKYQWPESPGIINAGNKFLAEIAPSGMKVLVLPGGLFEWTTWLMGMVPFSLALYDQPDLVDAVIERLSKIIYKGAEELMDIPNIGGLFIGDDMGFFSGTLVKPELLKKRFLPHLKKMVDLAHQAGKLVLLHSCGNLTSIMDDICDTGIDAKHSFEDKIMPVESAYQRWSDRIGIVGGVDVNLLSGATEESIRRRTREILDICGSGGRYVLGTGNSVASYIPIRNYLIMIDEGRRWNLEHFSREH